VAIFFTVTLIISIVGLVSLLGLKHWELSTGRVVGGSVRPAAGAYTQQGLSWMEYQAPTLLRAWARTGWRYVQVMLHRLAAFAILLIERGLEKLLQLVRHKTAVKHSDTEASAFLREVSAHKKQLLKVTRKERAIYDE